MLYSSLYNLIQLSSCLTGCPGRASVKFSLFRVPSGSAAQAVCHVCALHAAILCGTPDGFRELGAALAHARVSWLLTLSITSKTPLCWLS